MDAECWIAADTVRTDRKDFFCLTGDDQRHIGTLISGSRNYLERFERDVALMRKSPEMRDLLLCLMNEMQQNSLDENNIRALSMKAKTILDSVDAPFEEG